MKPSDLAEIEERALKNDLECEPRSAEDADALLAHCKELHAAVSDLVSAHVDWIENTGESMPSDSMLDSMTKLYGLCGLAAAEKVLE